MSLDTGYLLVILDGLGAVTKADSEQFKGQNKVHDLTSLCQIHFLTSFEKITRFLRKFQDQTKNCHQESLISATIGGKVSILN